MVSLIVAASWLVLAALKLVLELDAGSTVSVLLGIGCAEVALATLVAVPRMRAIGLVLSAALSAAFVIASYLDLPWMSEGGGCGCFGSALHARPETRRIVASMILLGSVAAWSERANRWCD